MAALVAVLSGGETLAIGLGALGGSAIAGFDGLHGLKYRLL